MCQAIRELIDEAFYEGTIQNLVKAALSNMKYYEVSEETAFPRDQWDMYRELVEQARAEQEDT